MMNASIDVIDFAWKLLTLVCTVVGLVGGWFLKMLFSNIAEIKKDHMTINQVITDLRVELPTDYVKKTELTMAQRDILTALRRLENKMDRMKFVNAPHQAAPNTDFGDSQRGGL